MPATETLTNQIRKFIPDDGVDIVVRWIVQYGIELKITNRRKSVFGDYRWPQRGKGHRISVNGDLNRYAFLITFVHEMAHLTTWEKHRNKVASHGEEWKREFKELMNEFAGRRIFPADIRAAFKQHLLSPHYTHCTDPLLMKVLRRYDLQRGTMLEEIQEGSQFEFEGKIFLKGIQLRKRFKCIEVRTKREYLFSPVAEVKLR